MIGYNLFLLEKMKISETGMAGMVDFTATPVGLFNVDFSSFFILHPIMWVKNIDRVYPFFDNHKSFTDMKEVAGRKGEKCGKK